MSSQSDLPLNNGQFVVPKPDTVHRMDVYEGKSTTNTNETGVKGLGTSVVAKMVSILDQPEQHEIFFLIAFSLVFL